MVKKSGLGRGISNFINDTKEVQKLINSDENKILDIDIDKILPNKNQARKDFDENSINELAKSIKEYGVISPIILIKKDDKYEIVAGERRYRACMLLKLKTIPAIVKDFNYNDASNVSIIENVQRQNLNPIEEARGYKQLLELEGLTQDELAAKIGKSRQYVGNTIRLLNLDKRVIEMIEKDLISPSHGKLLLSIKDPKQQFKEAKRIAKLNNSVTETRVLIENKTKKYDIFEKEALANLERRLGTKVDFSGTGKKKKIVIEYYSEEDLQRIYETIMGGEEFWDI